MADRTEEESKFDIEEVNLSCVKNEPVAVVTPEASLYITQYKITLEYENIFGGPSYKRDLEEYEDNLIGFMDNVAIMENVIIKLESVKREDGNINNCNNCNGDYKGYCIKCSSLSHILNNNVPLNYSKPEINTTPMDVLEIRDSSTGKRVFLLKALPKNVVFGPFEGLPTIESTKGFGWKINNNRLVDVENGNWMKNIVSTANISIKNLDVFQMEENLYFQTDREIMEGEELLVYYKDKEIQSDENKDCYFIPQKKKKLSKIFACTRCSLGFGFLKCLVEHKSKCPYIEHNRDPKADFLLVECHYCKIWMEKQENQEYHMDYCQKKSQRMSTCPSQSVDRNEVKIEEIEDRLKTEAHIKNKPTENGSAKYKCLECAYQANYKAQYRRHLIRHHGIKPFECGVCKMKFNQKHNLELHIKNKHTKNAFSKDYQCPECIFQTNYKKLYQNHLNGHRGIKPFECGICKTKFTTKGSLKTHIKYEHAGDKSTKEYQCNECTYQTNYQRTFQCHINKHRGIKPFECDKCKMKFSQKSNLQRHIKNKHTDNGNAKNFQCSECSFQTNDQYRYQDHLNQHRGIKTRECGICKMQFTKKDGLQMHMKNMHTENGSGKDYQCTECSYQTNYKQRFKAHQDQHRGIKAFECSICKTKFVRKDYLNRHIRNRHKENESGGKDYKCSDCSYQTNDKYHYQRHLNRHSVIKQFEFECDACKMTFYRKDGLESHIKRMHSGWIFLKSDNSDPNGPTGILYPVIYKNPTARPVGSANSHLENECAKNQ